MTIIYVAGTNTPGYLPDDDPYETTSFRDAALFLLDELNTDANGYADSPGPHHTAAITEAMLDLTETVDGDWSVTIQNRCYWICQTWVEANHG